MLGIHEGFLCMDIFRAINLILFVRRASYSSRSAAGVDWQFVVYGGAVHAFSDASLGTDPSQGVAYNAAADRRSWQAIKTFLNEALRP
jgi:dienelactone hydrolase